MTWRLAVAGFVLTRRSASRLSAACRGSTWPGSASERRPASMCRTLTVTAASLGALPAVARTPMRQWWRPVWRGSIAATRAI